MNALWSKVVEALEEQSGHPGFLNSAQPCAGGDINQAAVLDFDSGRVFLKYHTAAPPGMFEAEASALTEIGATDTVRVPRVLAQGHHGSTGFLALEYLALGRRSSTAEAELGRRLADLHRTPHAHFGWHMDNTIGTTPQPNPATDDWVEFFGQHRLRFQAERLAQLGPGRSLLSAMDRLIEQLPAFFRDYTPQPSLLHGDLWGGNHSSLADGTPVIFDPASYYGDRETDLAMTELFGGFDAEFRSEYEASWPLDPGYRHRRSLYQLYHVLNHANLFGGGYVDRSDAMIQQLLETAP